MSEPTWLLIAPAEDPKSARARAAARAGAAEMAVDYERTARQLGLRCTRDAKTRKIYLGLPKPATASKPVAGVTYPSGSVAARHPANNDPRYAPAHPGEAAPLVKCEPDIQVSKHFRLSEFRPKSAAYDGVRVHPDLVDLLERIRAAAGCSLHLTSAYRPPAYNLSAGGVPNSNHQDGTAADIYASELTVQQLRAVCEKVLGKSGGLGYYPGHEFCHVDIGPYARWQG